MQTFYMHVIRFEYNIFGLNDALTHHISSHRDIETKINMENQKTKQDMGKRYEEDSDS